CSTIVLSEPATRPPPASEDARSAGANPFPGPTPYQREDEAFFFGRDAEIDELTSLVLSSSAVLLDAPSGTGKSSLINAGLTPSLKRESFTIVPVALGKISPPAPQSQHAASG